MPYKQPRLFSVFAINIAYVMSGSPGKRAFTCSLFVEVPLLKNFNVGESLWCDKAGHVVDSA